MGGATKIRNGLRLRPALFAILALLLLGDLAYSAYQYYHQALEGDIARIVLPSESYAKVLDDPFGISVLTDGASYPATNRYFAHAAMAGWFRTMPFVMQHFMSPLDSVYFSAAMAKMLMHILLLLMLGMYVSGSTRMVSFDLLLAMVLVAPLFHNWGSGMYIGFIDYSVTYAFFYALPMGLLMLFFLPYFLEGFHGKKGLFKPVTITLLMLLAVILAFNGALVAPVVLMVCPAVLVIKAWMIIRKEEDGMNLRSIFSPFRKMPLQYSLGFGLFILLSLYSYYIGQSNSENFFAQLPLAERYERLPEGIRMLFTQRSGLYWLVFMMAANLVILYHRNVPRTIRINAVTLLAVVLLFTTAYFLLLPLGGYREYRPFIIREDTVMPALLALVLWYGITAYRVLNTLGGFRKALYVAILGVFLFVLVKNDPAHFGHYACERAALEELIASDEKIVKLNAGCPVMAWGPIHDPALSDVNCSMLQYWGVLKDARLYYQVSE